MNQLQFSEYNYLFSLISTYQTIHDVQFAMGDFVLTTHYWHKFNGFSAIERNTVHRLFFSACARRIDQIVASGGLA